MPFYDLNVVVSSSSGVEATSAATALSQPSLARIVTAAELLGIKGGVAFAHVVQKRMPTLSKKNPDVLDLAAFQTGGTYDKIQVYSRLTIEASEVAHVAFLAGDEAKTAADQDARNAAKGFDIVAVRPLTADVLAWACRNARAFDVLSLDLATRLPFRLAAKPLNAARDAGVALEVSFGPALRGGPTARRQLFANAQLLAHALGMVGGNPMPPRGVRRRGVLLTSAATRAEDMRAPRDAANLATLMGFTVDGALAAVSRVPEEVLQRGAQRRTGVVGVLKVEDAMDDDYEEEGDEDEEDKEDADDDDADDDEDNDVMDLEN